MDLKQMLAAVTVADTGSVTRAAVRLHLVQPAVTRQLRALEEDLGISLFDRGRRGMTLTPQGEVFVAHARRVLREVERVREELGGVGEVVGTVRVGLLESTCELLAEPLLRHVTQQHPKVSLQIEAAYSGHLLQWLDSGDLDVSMLYALDTTPSIAMTPIIDEQLWAVGPPGSGPRTGRNLSWAEVVEHPLVLPVAGHGLRVLIDAALMEHGLSVRCVAETNALAIQRQLVEAGHGWTVLPAAGVARQVADGTVTAAPIGTPSTTRSIGVGLSRAGRLPASAHAVARALVSVARVAASSEQWPGSSVLPKRD